ncbi:MAG: hypothetical protein AB2813_11860 [Candidatus Sedimenticola endophacoides]
MSEINIDLFGWDTTYAINYTHANKSIADLKATPPSFDYESKNSKGETVGSISGKWSDWQMTTKWRRTERHHEMPHLKWQFQRRL